MTSIQAQERSFCTYKTQSSLSLSDSSRCLLLTLAELSPHRLLLVILLPLPGCILLALVGLSPPCHHLTRRVVFSLVSSDYHNLILSFPSLCLLVGVLPLNKVEEISYRGAKGFPPSLTQMFNISSI